MKVETIGSIEDVLGVAQGYAKLTVAYPGVRSSEYELIPTIGRRRKGKSTLEPKDERYILKLFKQRAIAHLDRIPSDEWEWLAIAQHHGLPTRLLDWTRNPLVAAYFAVIEKCDCDSAIYAYNSGSSLRIEKHPDPFAVDHVARIIPNHSTLRITVQSGLFTIHPKPNTPFSDPKIRKYVIPVKERRGIRRTLDKLGINTASLFPGLDGIARHIDWQRTDEY